MNKIKIADKQYYLLKKSKLFIGIVIIFLIAVVDSLIIYKNTNVEKGKEIYSTEYEELKSSLENVEECFLCGNHQRSLVPYFRKHDGVGVIGLNEWDVLDFHFKEYDENGNEIDKSGSISLSGTQNGVTYHIDTIPSRGISKMVVSSLDDFSSDVIVNHLCQECLDKVTDTLVAYQYVGEKEMYYPFVLIDFETMELHSLQKWYTDVSLGDYWVEIEYLDDGEIELEGYYLSVSSE